MFLRIYSRVFCRHVIIILFKLSYFVYVKSEGRKCDLKSVNFCTGILRFSHLSFSLLIPQFSHLLTLRPILFNAGPCKLTEALKERTWKRAFSLFMGFSEFSRGL